MSRELFSIMRTGFGETAFCLKSNFSLSPRSYFHALGLVMNSGAFGLGLKAKSGLEYTASVLRPVPFLTYDPLFHSFLFDLYSTYSGLSLISTIKLSGKNVK